MGAADKREKSDLGIVVDDFQQELGVRSQDGHRLWIDAQQLSKTVLSLCNKQPSFV
jgi:hypothetical protein